MEKKKNIRFLICQIAVALIGLAWKIYRGAFSLLWIYVLFMTFAVIAMYFNYSLCKLENRMRSRFYDRTPHDGEPSDFRLVVGKVAEWMLFIMMLVVALLPI